MAHKILTALALVGSLGSFAAEAERAERPFLRCSIDGAPKYIEYKVFSENHFSAPRLVGSVLHTESVRGFNVSNSVLYANAEIVHQFWTGRIQARFLDEQDRSVEIVVFSGQGRLVVDGKEAATLTCEIL